jgi:hypothetical protein
MSDAIVNDEFIEEGTIKLDDSESGTEGGRQERVPIAELLEGEDNLDKRINLTEARFLEEIDELVTLKTYSDKEERIQIKIAELLLELEKVQLRRRREALETIVNWNHLQAVSKYFVRKLYQTFQEAQLDSDVEDQLQEEFMKAIENWETEIVKEGILENAAGE